MLNGGGGRYHFHVEYWATIAILRGFDMTNVTRK